MKNRINYRKKKGDTLVLKKINFCLLEKKFFCKNFIIFLLPKIHLNRVFPVNF